MSDDSKLETVPFRHDRLVLACHPQHPLALVLRNGKEIVLTRKLGAREVRHDEVIWQCRTAVDL